MSESAVLSVHGLNKSFGTERVLENVGFEVGPGRFVGFVGPNGAGKTTALRCLLGICHPDAGSVRVAGVDARRDPLGARRRVGYLPGETSLYRGMRGQEILDFGLAFHPRVDRELLEYCQESFNLPLRRKIRTYSAGQKQLLALTMALAPDVPVYVLDEPDKALDATMRHELRLLLRRRKAGGRSLLISSHHISELEGVADDYLFLLDGRIISESRVEAERQKVERRIRATFAQDPTTFDLPSGTTIERDNGAFVFVPAADAELEVVVRAILTHHPRSLDYGHATLQEIYEALYVNGPRKR